MGSGAFELISAFLLAASFYPDVAPILERRCQTCHRSGGMAPMPLTSYEEVRPWAKAIRQSVIQRTMPPWPADRNHGRFANDPTLPESEILTIRDWVDSGSPRGKSADRRAAKTWPDQWTIRPDLIAGMPRPFRLPARGEVDYQYVVIPLGLKKDQWVNAVEAKPGNRTVVHHIVLYVRQPGSDWLKEVPAGEVWAPKGRTIAEKRSIGHTTSDILLVYAPGSAATRWRAGMAKKIQAGSDLVLQIHYTPNGKPASDQTQVALEFAAGDPQYQVLTLQMGTDRIRIPPGDSDYRLTVSGTMPNDALLLSLFPHMHLRGKSFEYRLTGANGQYETLLKIPRWNFNWQMDYVLAEPKLLRAGQRLQIEAHYDNSANNPDNPDPSAEVEWGESSFEEMMIGFFDLAVDPKLDKGKFFERTGR